MKFFPKTTSTNIFYDELSTLTKLANKLETDKGTADSSTLSWGKNWPDHFCMGYTLTYEKYMNQFRDKAVKLFEIGICEKNKDIKLLNEWGINFIHADQGNFCDWEEIKKECPSDFDFIIEDGSHWPNHMAVSLWQSCNMIKSGGYYFMEDLQNPTTARGKFKYDNSLLAEDLFVTQKTGVFNSHFLNDKQNSEVNTAFELVEMVLDKNDINYIVVFRKK